MKFQQFSAPVQAKGVEDTGFYRYNALHVAQRSRRRSRSVRHARSRSFTPAIASAWSAGRCEMIATRDARYETRRGCTRPPERALGNAGAMAAGRRRVDARSTRRAGRPWIGSRRRIATTSICSIRRLLGVWPAEPIDAPVPHEAPPESRRAGCETYMQKAIKEAKTHTSWFNQNAAYEDAVSRFVDATLTGAGGRTFLASFVPFLRRVAVRGMVNSLAQLVLKMASPGVPDFYQGTEDWQLDMADPDNRRPVDFARRQAMLAELSPWIATSEAIWNGGAAPTARTSCDLADYVREMLGSWCDARIKMFLMACGLRLRRGERRLLLHGAYLPVMTDGAAAAHVVGFVRVSDGKRVLAVVPRLTSARQRHELDLSTGPDVWADTRIGLPHEVASGEWRNVFTGANVTPVADERGWWMEAADVFEICPVALLWSRAGSRGSNGAALST